jgi:DNA-binding transcriptional LysR family regulator
LDGAGPVLAQLLALETNLEVQEQPPAKLRVVCECYTAYRWLPSAIMKMRSSMPTLELALVVEHSGNPVPALLSGDIDVALLTTAPVRVRGGSHLAAKPSHWRSALPRRSQIALQESTCRLVPMGKRFLIRVDLNRARATH